MVLLKLGLLRQPQDSQHGGHRASARREDGSGQQHLSVRESGLGKEGREQGQQCGNIIWQGGHGFSPLVSR